VPHSFFLGHLQRLPSSLHSLSRSGLLSDAWAILRSALSTTKQCHFLGIVVLLIDLCFRAIIGDKTAADRMAILQSEPEENLVTVRRLNRNIGGMEMRRKRAIRTVDSSSDIRKKMFLVHRVLADQISEMIWKILIGYLAIVSGLFVCKMLRLF